MSIRGGPGGGGGFGSYYILSDSQYTTGAPLNLVANVKTAVPNNRLKLSGTARFNMKDTVWQPLQRRFRPEFVNAVYSIRLSFTCHPPNNQPGRRWVQASFETPSVVAIVDTRLLTTDPPPGGQSFVFSWLVPVPDKQTVLDGAKFFAMSNVALPIFDIRMAFFRVGSGLSA